jgi:N-acetylglucosamine-6-sulfatase
MTEFNRRDFLKTAGMAAVGSLCAVHITEAAGILQDFLKTRKRPNVVFILSDDQRADMTSCAGNKYIRTPHLDRLANEGALFENAFCTAGVCSPSRASFFTGKYAHQCGAPGIVWCNNTFLENEIPFPALLQRAGYHTAHIGKWHLGKGNLPKPGYDYWAGFEWLGDFFNTKITINGVEKQFEGFADDIISNLAAEHIEKVSSDKKQFCMFVGLKAPHLPFSYPERYENLLSDAEIPKPESYYEDYDVSGKPEFMKNNFIRIDKFGGGLPMFGNSWDKYVKAYYRSSQAIDDAVGVILDAIDKNCIADDTIVIYSSDQGYSLGEHGNTEKHYAYEEVMRIPMIVRYPKMIKAGLRNKEMVLNIDIAPTVLDLAGVKVPKDVAGRSIVPLFKGENKIKNWRNEFLFKQESEGFAIPGQIAVRTAEYKLITYQSFPDKELYDLTKDPHEVHNVANDTSYSSVLKDMETRLENLKKQTNLKPYVHYPVENIFVFVNRDKWPLEKAENYIFENSKDSKCFSDIKNKDSRWTSVKLQKSGQFVLDKDGLSDESVFIAFDIEALTKKPPFTKVSIQPSLKLIGYVNGKKIWDSQAGALNEFNPPLKKGHNIVVVKIPSDKANFNISVSGPEGSIRVLSQ